MSEQDLQYVTKAQLDSAIRMIRQEILGAGGGLTAHSSTHESGGSDTVDHNLLVNYVSDRHRKITISTSDPSGGSDGDVWLKYTA